MSDPDPEGKTISAPMLPAVAPESSNTLELRPKLLAGRYELLGMLGAGAMGTVYRACDRELDEIVALKVLKKELASPDMLERHLCLAVWPRRLASQTIDRAVLGRGDDPADRAGGQTAGRPMRQGS